MRAEIFINLPPVGVSILFFSREHREETCTIRLQLRPRPQINGSLLTRGWLSFSSSVRSTNQPISWASSSGSHSDTGSSVTFPNLLCRCAECPSQTPAAAPGLQGLAHNCWPPALGFLFRSLVFILQPRVLGQSLPPAWPDPTATLSAFTQAGPTAQNAGPSLCLTLQV